MRILQLNLLTFCHEEAALTVKHKLRSGTEGTKLNLSLMAILKVIPDDMTVCSALQRKSTILQIQTLLKAVQLWKEHLPNRLLPEKTIQ